MATLSYKLYIKRFNECGMSNILTRQNYISENWLRAAVMKNIQTNLKLNVENSPSGNNYKLGIRDLLGHF